MPNRLYHIFKPYFNTPYNTFNFYVRQDLIQYLRHCNICVPSLMCIQSEDGILETRKQVAGNYLQLMIN